MNTVQFSAEQMVTRHNPLIPARTPTYPTKGLIRNPAILAVFRDAVLDDFGRFSGIWDQTFGLDGHFQGTTGSDLYGRLE